jgi:hypothetical protein
MLPNLMSFGETQKYFPSIFLGNFQKSQIFSGQKITKFFTIDQKLQNSILGKKSQNFYVRQFPSTI